MKLRNDPIKALILSIACAISLGTGFAAGMAKRGQPPQYDRAERIEQLVDELVKSPERQQLALDEIAKDGDGAYIYLLNHLDDTRPLASEYVQYLSTHPSRPERYSLIRSKTIGEALLRYLCWSTESCQFNFERADKKAETAQRETLVAFCRKRWLDPSGY